GEATRYLSINKVKNTLVDRDINVIVLSPDFLFSLNFPSIMLAILELKVNALIIILRNIDLEEGLYNRT
ncbi:hypothetical protein C8A01DRAFT_21567, partial [Parachaetomium inaequale]